MKVYDSGKPLVSLHIPKCAGQSFRMVLEKWFDDRFYTHYYQQNNAPPPIQQSIPGICIHGHFNRSRGFGVYDYYPKADQFITVMRNPLEAAISNYFYWKEKARNIQINNGVITEGGIHDYRDIDDYFQQRPKSNMLDFMPLQLTSENYRDFIKNSFIWIGLVDKLQDSVDRLANILGFSTVLVNRINVSSWTTEPTSETCQSYIENNTLQFEIYEYVRGLISMEAS